MAWKIEIERRAEIDLGYAYDHFIASALGFGNSEIAAAQIARRRMDRTFDALDRLAKNPYRGTLHNDIAYGLRHVTIEDAIFWFRLEEADKIMRVTGIFHGGQDHLQRMLDRLTKVDAGNDEGA